LVRVELRGHSILGYVERQPIAAPQIRNGNGLAVHIYGRAFRRLHLNATAAGEVDVEHRGARAAYSAFEFHVLLTVALLDGPACGIDVRITLEQDRKSTRLNSS